jgi:large subunit ribosomal protein L9
MKVILQENISNLGKVGDVVDVRPGFARNFLLPKSKVMLATPANMEIFDNSRDVLEKAALQLVVDAKARGEELAKLTLALESLASDEGKLFGSIGPREVVEAVAMAGGKITKQEVVMPDGPIREVGTHEVALMPHADVTITVTLTVTAKS